MLISETYRELNRKLHESQPKYGMGLSSRYWYAHIDVIAKELKALSILDYGAGKQALSHAMPHLLVRAYDPAIPALSARPEPADLVVCTDVLEHVEPECLDAVLGDLHRCAVKGIFLTIAMRPALKFL